MAQRRPITSHPAFAPLLALWFAALLGLGVAVLPAGLLARMVDGSGLAALVPPMPGGRLAVSAAAALGGALLGWLLAIPLARRGIRDPRPIYDEPEPLAMEMPPVEPARRPLLARDDLPDEPDTGEGGVADGGLGWSTGSGDPAPPPVAASEPGEGFMILSPQPVHPPRPAPDLDALLEQFDDALAAFRADADPRPAAETTGEHSSDRLPGTRTDPVHAFVARQTGAPAPSPLGGRMPDHQAELRAALDKLAQSQRDD